MTSQRSFLTRWRVRLGYPLAVICFVLARPSPRSLLIGSALAVVGLLNRASAAGYLRKGSGLATSGPYSRTRNPLYFGSTILAAGFAIAANSWIAAACLAIYIAVFYPAVMRREESDLRAAYGAEFDAYAARVPLFFPTLRGRGVPGEGFSWAQYLRNREYQAAVGTGVALAILCVRMEFKRIGLDFNSRESYL
jgi:protein-S-isoprenylcysteine O-methyltransferase Ste14